MNVVFDFGGVVLHWQPHELMRRTLSQHAVDDAAAHALADRFFEGYGGDWGEFDRGVIEVPDLARRIAARAGLALADVQAVIDAVPGELLPQQATVDLLQRLRHRGRPLFYLSNMPAVYAEHLERSHAFFEHFEDGVFSSRVHLIKPDPAIFELAARRFGVDPSQTVFVDDSAHNVEAALALGWQAIRFHSAPQVEQELRTLGFL